ncbi:MAG: hypothetical protein WA231_22060 [Methylocella sp.]
MLRWHHGRHRAAPGSPRATAGNNDIHRHLAFTLDLPAGRIAAAIKTRPRFLALDRPAATRQLLPERRKAMIVFG